MKKPRLLATCALTLCALSSPVQADLLNAGDTLCVDFSVSDTLTNVPDVLHLRLGALTVNAAFTSRTATLYDGNTLLGVNTLTNFGTYVGPLALSPSNAFKSATSVYTFNSPTVIDFTTIQDGSINGHLEFTIATGQMDIDLAQVTVNLGRAISGSGLQETGPDPTLLCVSITTGGCVTNAGEPACFGSNVLCPCLNAGASGNGCANSNPNDKGAKLSAEGNAFLSCDTFQLSVTHAAINKPGLVFSGTVDLSPGINTIDDNAGLLCVGGATVRGFVVFTDATGAASMPDFKGAAYGQATNVTVNTLSTYQFWFRDPDTACLPNNTVASDFNFSNMWRVTWLP